jgi:hypothetical protein
MEVRADVDSEASGALVDVSGSGKGRMPGILEAVVMLSFPRIEPWGDADAWMSKDQALSRLMMCCCCGA